MTGSKNHFEIERKYRLSKSEYDELPKTLKHLGFSHKKEVVENDTFLPVEKKGDMLRIRDEKEGQITTHILTRKTWVETKGERERSEQEEEVSSFVRNTILEVVERANEKSLRHLSKKRTFFAAVDDGEAVTVTLDYVDQIGQYSGPYMEVEFLVHNQEDVPRFRDKIKQLAKTLLQEERDYVQTSYQEMLALFLEKQGGD
jgi:predicted adenylyl cyclase CyaB